MNSVGNPLMSTPPVSYSHTSLIIILFVYCVTLIWMVFIRLCCNTSHLPVLVKECAASSPTSYFWFRKALDIADSIDQSGEFNPIMTGCLLAAWAIVCLAMIKGIKSSAKVQHAHVCFSIMVETFLVNLLFDTFYPLTSDQPFYIVRK